MTGGFGDGVSTRIFTVPNALSAARLALVPVFLTLVIQGNDLVALGVLVISSLTDFLDGFIARRFGSVTRLGQLLDPAADRLFIFATLIGLAIRDIVPWWFVWIIVAREVFLLVLFVILALHKFGPLPVRHVGKIATFCLLYALPSLMLAQVFPAVAFLFIPLGWVFGGAGAIFYWWAGILYAKETVRVIRNRRARDPLASDTLER
jgi:cardiolipin synthase (CMP-forming)